MHYSIPVISHLSGPVSAYLSLYLFLLSKTALYMHVHFMVTFQRCKVPSLSLSLSVSILLSLSIQPSHFCCPCMPLTFHIPGSNSSSSAVPLPESSILEALARYDTPTICNALEVIAPHRRGPHGHYTTKQMYCAFPDLPPMVGYARTATIRSATPSRLPALQERQLKLDYFEYMGSGAGPRITVIQDLDADLCGLGSWWGEVHSAIHKALGCLGVITDGSVRDIPQIAPGFQLLAGSGVVPSHAHVHVDDFNKPVRIHGMDVNPVCVCVFFMQIS